MVIGAQIEPTHGKITIDNVDISRIDPHILRSRLVSHLTFLFQTFAEVPRQTFVPQVTVN
jgi:ABC-type proline/glycine betaine transport system ATPase subunit